MNKSLTLFFCLLLLISAACKKPHRTDPPVETHEVTFNISGLDLNLTTGPIVNSVGDKLKTNSTTPYFLSYTLYDQSNKTLTIKQTDGTSTPVIKDNIPNGTYTATFFLINLSANSGYVVPSGGNIQNITNSNDFFSKKITFVVSGNSVTQNVILNRIDAKIEVKLKDDTIPKHVSRIYLSLPDSTQFNTLTQQYLSPATVNTLGVYLDGAKKGITPAPFASYTSNHITPFTLSIVAVFDNSAQTYTKVISNVVCERNKITVLTGKLFGGTAGIGVSIPKTWAPADTVKF
ncbi:hypothetical protein [Mucilaginibacter sp.]|uniref:hypothetical protein n=1 Tax=Mucilaginibacter sp. TaxID=1882438 RepID=UPI0032662FFF